MTYEQTLAVFQALRPGDKIEVRHTVTVGFRSWQATVRGTVLRTDRVRHSLHFRRNFDDKVYSDIIVLRRDDGELTTVTLDEFTELERQDADAQQALPAHSP
jgi:hypothetical protein